MGVDFADFARDKSDAELRAEMDDAVPFRSGKAEPHILDAKAPLQSAHIYLNETKQDESPTLCHWRGRFYRWNGAAWRPVDDDAIRAAIYAFLEEAKKLDGKDRPVPFNPNSRRVSDAIDALKAAAHLGPDISSPAWTSNVPDLPPPRECVACSNGILNLLTGKRMPATPRLFTHNALSFDHDPRASDPIEWIRFLHSIWPDDAACVETLQEWFGYCLTTDTRQQKALLIVGPKRSGKGTIARVLRHLVGEANAVGPTLASLGSNFGLQPMIDSSLAIVADARLDGRSDLSSIGERILSITGEDVLTVDRKYNSPWTGQLPTRLMLLSNELPRFKDASGALASRFIVLTLHQSFYSREDRGLLNRILPELPGILNWAVEGWNRLQKRGYFCQPQSSDAAIEELEALASPVAAFVRDKCRLGPTEDVNCETLFNVWVEWCNKQGVKAGTSSVFGRDLKSACPEITDFRPRTEIGRVRQYRGIGLA